MIQNVISTEVEANSVKVKRKVYETGDHKNVANLEPFIATLETLGGIYNPTKELLKIDQLEALRADCSHTLLHLYTVKNIWTVRVTERTELFDKMGKYVNRILAAYKLQENNPERLKDFEALIRKLKGKRSIAIDEAAVKDGSKKIHSVSQYSVDSRIANLTKVLDMIMANPNYAPNEMDLKVEAIQAYLQELKLRIPGLFKRILN